MTDGSEAEVAFDDFHLHFPNRHFGHRNRSNGVVDGQPVFFRRGTVEARGVRITLREDLREGIASGAGFLAVSRGRCYLIPLEFVRDWLGGKLTQRTIDVRVDVNSHVLEGPGVEPTDVGGFAGVLLE